MGAVTWTGGSLDRRKTVTPEQLQEALQTLQAIVSAPASGRSEPGRTSSSPWHGLRTHSRSSLTKPRQKRRRQASTKSAAKCARFELEQARQAADRAQRKVLMAKEAVEAAARDSDVGLAALRTRSVRKAKQAEKEVLKAQGRRSRRGC